MAGMWARPGARASAADLPQLRDFEPVVLRALLDRFLAPRQRLGDRADRHALAGERVQLLDLVLPPRLPMPLEPLAHYALPSSADFLRQPSIYHGFTAVMRTEQLGPRQIRSNHSSPFPIIAP